MDQQPTQEEKQKYQQYVQTCVEIMNEQIQNIKASMPPHNATKAEHLQFEDDKRKRIVDAMQECQTHTHQLAEAFLHQDPAIRKGHEIASGYKGKSDVLHQVDSQGNSTGITHKIPAEKMRYQV